jgi:hypothetical protein
LAFFLAPCILLLSLAELLLTFPLLTLGPLLWRLPSFGGSFDTKRS